MNKFKNYLFYIAAFSLFSCGKNETVGEPRIISQCNGVICSIALYDVQLNRFTNFLGKKIDREISRKALGDATDQLIWTIEDPGKLAESTQLMSKGLTPCLNEKCDLSSNPTGWIFDEAGDHNIYVRGTVVNQDGSKKEVDLHGNVRANIAAPIIVAQTNDGISYQFNADIENTGISEDSTFSWYVNDVLEQKGSKTFPYTFENAASEYKVSLKVESDAFDDISTKIDFRTGAKTPEINIGNIKGNIVNVSVDIYNSGLPDGTIFEWSVEQDPSIWSTGTSTSLELPNYATNYTIKLLAKPPQGAVLTATIPVTSGYGTPTITSQQTGGSGLDYEFDVDTTGTGIPSSGVAYKWYVNGNEVGTSKNLAYIFDGENQSYRVKAEVTTNGETVTSETTLNTGTAEQPNLTATPSGENPLTWRLDANITNTVIDSSWTKEWYVDNQLVNSGETSIQYNFTDPVTSYNIEFKAKKNNLERRSIINISTSYGTPTITSQQTGGSGLDYEFDVDTTGTGIPSSGVAYKWHVNGNEVGTSKKLAYIFDGENQSYIVKAEVTANGKIVTSETTINTGAADQPNLTASQIGNNSLSWRIEADTTNTLIDSGWTKEWYIDGNKESETSVTLNHVFSEFASSHSIMFIATSPDSSLKREATFSLITGYGTPTITSQQTGGSGLDYEFDVDTTGTGIPSSGVAYKWYVNDNEVGTSKNLAYIFDGENQSYIVKTEVTANGKTVTSETTINTGAADQPNLTASEAGSDPLVWVLNADISNTIIDDNWTKEWFVNGSLISGDTKSISHRFALSGTSYNVEFKATKGNLIRRATTQIVVRSATPPQIEDNGSIIEGDLKYQLQANLVNTGITDDWSFNWSSSPTATFSTANSLTVATFPNYATSYTVTLTATPPSNLNSGLLGASSQQPVTQTKIITTGQEPIKYPNQARLYITHQTIGPFNVTAAEVARLYNLKSIPNNVSSVTSQGDYLIFTCKSGYGVTQSVAENLAGNTTTNTNKNENGVVAPSYLTIDINNHGFRNMGAPGNIAYNGYFRNDGRNGHEYGVNCFKI